MAFSKNPLYRYGGEKLRDAARKQLQRTSVGRILLEAERASKSARKAPAQLQKTVAKFGTLTGSRAMREVLGTDIGKLAGDIQRYSRGGGKVGRVIDSVLDELGPVGSLLRTITKRRGKRRGVGAELSKAIDLLSSFFPALQDQKTTTAANMGQAISAAQQILEEAGYTVLPPGEEPPNRGGGFPYGISPNGPGGKPRRSVRLPIEKQRHRAGQRWSENLPLPPAMTAPTVLKRFPADHPIVTGDMVRAHRSSNVYSFGYDIEAGVLYIRFRIDGPSDDQGRRPDEPGAIYQYRNVPARVFLAMLKAPSKGTFIWDNIRERGTISGHVYDYSLVGVQGGYVPRKATLKRDGEWFERRSVRSDKGRVLISPRPNALVRPLRPTNNTGAPRPPNRGTPRRT